MQSLLRLPRPHSQLQHHQRHSHIVSRRPQSVFRRRQIPPARRHQDPKRPVPQLFIGQHCVNHQVLIHMSQPRHRRRAQHVQHHLLRRPRLHPPPPRHHFRPHPRRNHDFRQPPHRHPQVGRHRHRRRATPPRILQRTHHIRRRPARCNSHHHISLCQLLRPQVPLPVPLRILRPFHRSRNRPPSPRNQRHHQLRRSPKRRRTLRRIQHAHPPARSRPHLNQPPALSNPAHNRIHRPRNRRQLPPNSRRHPTVLAIHQPHDLPRRHAIKIFGSRVSLLGASAVFLLRRHHRIIAAHRKPSRIHYWKNASLVNAKHSNASLTNISSTGISYARKRLAQRFIKTNWVGIHVPGRSQKALRAAFPRSARAHCAAPGRARRFRPQDHPSREPKRKRHRHSLQRP